LYCSYRQHGGAAAFEINIDATEKHSLPGYLSRAPAACVPSRIDTRALRLAFALQSRISNNRLLGSGGFAFREIHNDVPVNGARDRGSLVSASFGN
jgi:hypothetical protein